MIRIEDVALLALAPRVRISTHPRLSIDIYSLSVASPLQGYTAKLDLSTPVVDCGPILPSSFPGQAPRVMPLTLTNPGDYPMEVISLDFDKRYLEEEDILRSLDRWEAVDRW